MGGAGPGLARAHGTGAAAGAEVQPGAHGPGQTRVAGYDQDEAALAADAGEGLGEGGAARRAVVAEDHAGATARQAGGGGERVGEARGVGEEPEGWP